MLRHGVINCYPSIESLSWLYIIVLFCLLIKDGTNQCHLIAVYNYTITIQLLSYTVEVTYVI